MRSELSRDCLMKRNLDHQVIRRLRTKDVMLVKVLWRNHNFEEETWEAEEDMKKIYSHLFSIFRYALISLLPIVDMHHFLVS
ncbi:hypothetical protein MTR67_044787 [Solanum verrucosum]|uniref:Chromo domain-containing protein n=1 Tax=Solanum verrucosum TaxID=315347 RepID=A0AAF0US58_SOLVR|nr:hypothetical protein MTR67_044787 [Solanum verrucosum]